MDSAIQQIAQDVQRLESLSGAYAQGWNDNVSEKVFGAIFSLTSNASSISSQLSSYGSMLNSIKAELSNLAQ